MKKNILLLLLLLLLINSVLFGAKIDKFASHMGYFRDYKEALTLAKKENKILFVVQVSDYCPWCRKFERKTLQYSAIAIKINQNFISVVLDRDIDKGKYPEKLYSDRIPTTYFIDSNNEEVLKESMGYIKKKDFIVILDEFLSEYGDIKWEKYF